MFKLSYNKIMSVLLIISVFLYFKISYADTNSVIYTAAGTTELPIIMYHHISPKQKLWGKYVISDKHFEEDLKYIKKCGYTTITMTQLIDHVYNKTELPEKPIIITFDDGNESFYAYAYPLLKKYEMSAVISIVGQYTDNYTKVEDHNLDYSSLNWNQVKELSQSKFVEIQNHTYNMHTITKNRKGCGIKKGESIEAYKKDLNDDIGKLQEQIYKYTGTKPNTFTYPYGHISAKSKDIIKDMGFKAILTCAEQINVINSDSNFLYSLGRFNRPHGKSSAEFFKNILHTD